MAETTYHVLRRHAPKGDDGAEPADGENGGELFELLPGTFTGNPTRRAAEKHGEGEYIAVPLASSKRYKYELTEPRLQTVK